VILLLLFSRIPLMAEYFSIDNVNLAFALEKFDPRVHQPQPPGYPLFVLFAYLVHFVLRDAWRTFAVISILASALSLWAGYLLGRRMFSPWAGAAATCLLLVNPAVWQADIDGPLRPFLTLFSLVTAYCCWRCWNGEKRFAMWGAVALGIGGGFRPDLIAFLFPLWLVSSWVGTRSLRTVLQAGAVLCEIVAVWVGATIIAMGGLQTFRNIMSSYIADWSLYSAAEPGTSILGWLRHKNRLFIWNGIGVLTWIWAVPFCFFNRQRQPLGMARVAFFALWILPGVILQAATHFASPGHTLFSVAALCVIGGYVLSSAPSRYVVTGAALLLNAVMFLNVFGLPEVASKEEASKTPGPSLKNAVHVGIYESSVGFVRHIDGVTRDGLSEIEKFTPSDRPSVIVTTDSYSQRWFMNWRIGRYYLPKRDFWVMEETRGKKRVLRIRRDKVLVNRSYPLTIPVSREGRVLFLLEPDGPFYAELAKAVPLKGGTYVSYVDITPDSPVIQVDEFEIIPSSADGP
ncbi:MAG: hypothetical protein H6Q07_2162, partial [Acidobacteria bacterium]|nr:hypothetical protein [Acidobacteriota bacterium]